MDNFGLQFRGTNDLPGLVHFKRSDSAVWSDPFRWPHLSVGMDLGSDGLAGHHFLERRELLNTDATPDVSHGGNRDVINMLHGCNVFQLRLLWVISMNLAFVPGRTSRERHSLESRWSMPWPRRRQRLRRRYRPTLPRCSRSCDCKASTRARTSPPASSCGSSSKSAPGSCTGGLR